MKLKLDASHMHTNSEDSVEVPGLRKMYSNLLYRIFLNQIFVGATIFTQIFAIIYRASLNIII